MINIFEKPKAPLWYGIEGIHLIWHGEWSDPELLYKGKLFNYWDIDEGMYSIFQEETGLNDTDEYNEWMTNNKETVINYLDDVIFGGYNYEVMG